MYGSAWNVHTSPWRQNSITGDATSMPKITVIIYSGVVGNPARRNHKAPYKINISAINAPSG